MFATKIKAILLASALALAGQSVLARELTASAWTPPTHVFVKDVLLPWAAAIEAGTEGRVTIRLLPQPVASAPGHFDAVRDGLVDIAFISPTYLPGKMPLTVFGQMPFEAEDTTAHSVAFERAYTRFIAPKTDEFADVVYLGSWFSAPGQLWTSSREIDGLASISGLKIRVAGPLAQRIAEGIGAAPIFKPASEVFELLSGGVVDGVLFPTEAVCGFRIDDVVKHGAIAKGGIYSDMFFMFANSDVWDELSEEDQAVFRKYSGEYLSELAGKAIQKQNDECLDSLRARGVKETPLPPDVIAAVEAAVKPSLDQWRAEAASAGIDPDEVLAFYNQQIRDLAGK